MKTCTRCQASKPLSEFYPHRGCQQGVTPECRSCMRDRARMDSRLLAYLRGLVGLGVEGPTQEDRDRWREQEKSGATW